MLNSQFGNQKDSTFHWGTSVGAQPFLKEISRIRIVHTGTVASSDCCEYLLHITIHAPPRNACAVCLASLYCPGSPFVKYPALGKTHVHSVEEPATLN